jgi:CHRD domain
MLRRLARCLALVLLVGLAVLGLPGVAGAGQRVTVLSANLRGAKEVPGPGDPDGRGRAVIRLSGDQVCFALRWSGIAAPNAAHIHLGGPEVAGPVVVPFFGDPAGPSVIPDTVTSVRGCVTADPALVAAIARHPRAYYTNIHTPDFPAGAVRGQLHRGGRDLGVPRQLRARLLGANEVPSGDPDGRGRAFVRARGDTVCFEVRWRNLDPVVAGHIHAGVRGVNGPVVVPFFGDPAGPPVFPAQVSGADGCIQGLDRSLVMAIREHPGRYYVNLHTTQFRAGAIRGQLHRS